MMVYSFTNEEWSEMIILYKRYKDYIPMFLNSCLTELFHISDVQTIKSEDELYLWIQFLQCVLAVLDEKTVIEESEKKQSVKLNKPSVDIDYIQSLLVVLNNIYVEINRKQEEEMVYGNE